MTRIDHQVQKQDPVPPRPNQSSRTKHLFEQWAFNSAKQFGALEDEPTLFLQLIESRHAGMVGKSTELISDQQFATARRNSWQAPHQLLEDTQPRVLAETIFSRTSSCTAPTPCVPY